MTLLKFTPHMISNQPDQTAYLLNKLAEGHGGGGIGTLYNTTGQHTDGAMTQKATTNALGTKADALAVGQALAGKVDKEAGKGLSSNDFTNEELGKLNGIQAGAEVNVQSDWDQTDTSADDYIKNKPTIPAGAVLYPSTGQNTDGAMTQKASSDLFNNAVYVGTGSAGTLTPWVDTSDIVNGAVTSSKIDFTLQSGTITIPTGSNVDSINTTYCYCRRFGKIVDIEIRGHLVGGSSWTANTSVFNQLLVPDGFRPVTEVTCAGYVAAHGSMIFWILPNGEVELRPTETFTLSSSGTNFGGHTMFIIS